IRFVYFLYLPDSLLQTYKLIAPYIKQVFHILINEPIFTYYK
ncbi:MAG: hypothetical protein JWR54_2040, partial [Mucilaginibacter sp.]|nr:hypothetical protein [Mucilaginibacter sp.]